MQDRSHATKLTTKTWLMWDPQISLVHNKPSIRRKSNSDKLQKVQSYLRSQAEVAIFQLFTIFLRLVPNYIYVNCKMLITCSQIFIPQYQRHPCQKLSPTVHSQVCCSQRNLDQQHCSHCPLSLIS